MEQPIITYEEFMALYSFAENLSVEVGMYGKSIIESNKTTVNELNILYKVIRGLGEQFKFKGEIIKNNG